MSKNNAQKATSGIPYELQKHISRGRWNLCTVNSNMIIEFKCLIWGGGEKCRKKYSSSTLLFAFRTFHLKFTLFHATSLVLWELYVIRKQNGINNSEVIGWETACLWVHEALCLGKKKKVCSYLFKVLRSLPESRYMWEDTETICGHQHWGLRYLSTHFLG